MLNMKTLFIHLSDLHLSKHNISNDYSINQFMDCFTGDADKYNRCFLIFSGDCTMSGKKEDFLHFDKFINLLIDKLSGCLKTDVSFLVVPGNHDNYLLDEAAPEISDITSGYKKGERKVESMFLQTMPSMKNAFNFCRKYDIEFFNKAIVYKKISAPGKEFDYHFVLINSAPFSCMDHVDKDVHFIPSLERDIQGGPSYGKKTVEVLISHHRPDWFEEKSKDSIDKFINETASICLFGHDHTDQIYSSVQNNENVIYSRAGRLYLERQLTGSFSKIVIDENKNTCSSSIYSYSTKFNKYVEKKSADEFYLRLNDCLSFNLDYLCSFININVVDNLHESDVFVFPTLRPNGNQQYIESFEQLSNVLDSDKTIIISGYSNVGKSALLHKLFLDYANEKWRIFLDCTQCESTNIERKIRTIFNETYKYANYFYDEFYKTKNKIIFLDNFDKVQNQLIQNNIIRYCKEHFDYIALTISDLDIKTFRQSLGALYDADKTYTISGFSIKKRFELYKKICSLNNVEEDDVAKVSSYVEASIKMCSVIDMSDPFYLCILTHNIVTKNIYYERNTSDAFTIVFRHSLEKALVDASSEEKLSNLNSILSQLAFNMTFNNKTIYFSASDLQNALDERSSKFKNISLDFDDVLNIFKKANLIKKSNGKYRFQRNSYVAYFASQEVVRLYSRGEHKYMEEAVNDIVSGINGDVFLFAAYQLRQVDVFFKIQDFLDDILKGFNEIDFKEKNNAVLIKNKILIPESKEQQENKQQFYDRIDKSEQKAIVRSENDESKVYDKKYDDEVEAILKAIKMIEISCKAIAGFDTEIEATERELLIEKTIGSSLKLANLVFSFNEEDIETINREFEKWKHEKILELETNNEGKNKIEALKKIDIVRALYDFLTTWILNLECNMAEIMASSSSIQFIVKIDDSTFCRKIFKLMAFTAMQRTDSFIAYLEKIYDKGNKELTYILDRIVRVFIIKNQLDYKQRNKLSSITGINEKKILLYSGKTE